LTAIQNLVLRAKLSEYHTGLRAYSRKVLTTIPFAENSDDFVFDNQMLAQCIWNKFRIGEVSCPTKYFPEASSINWRRSVRYGFGVLQTTGQFVLESVGLTHFRIFENAHELRRSKALIPSSDGGVEAGGPRRLEPRPPASSEKL
jgi:hypothetical protein